jgi:hypothetical protein
MDWLAGGSAHSGEQRRKSAPHQPVSFRPIVQVRPVSRLSHDVVIRRHGRGAQDGGRRDSGRRDTVKTGSVTAPARLRAQRHDVLPLSRRGDSGRVDRPRQSLVDADRDHGTRVMRNMRRRTSAARRDCRPARHCRFPAALYSTSARSVRAHRSF